MKRYFSLIIIFICIAIPLHAHAGVYDVSSYVGRTISGISGWWTAKSINPPSPPFDKGGNKLEPPFDKGGNKLEPPFDKGGKGGFEGPAEPAETGAPGMCQVAQQPPVIVCEEGSGFLCINTPEPGVSGNLIIIKGTIDRVGSVPASIGVSVQHEYTKKTSYVDTSDPETTDCWRSSLASRPFCLDEKGFYAAKVPLEDLGPYTVAIGATRLAGQSVTQTVRTSRVKALEMKDNQVSFDPDVRTTTTVDKPAVNVTVSLIGDCQHCDFIGASTFGVTVTVENVMTDSKGNTSHIICITNVEQSGQGKFVVGVPVGPGANELSVTACNAAMTSGSCPKISGVKFQGSGGIEGIEIVSPPPLPAYSKAQYTTIPFEFKIKGMDAGECVNLTFNRNQPLQVCPASNGNYVTDLSPQVGINVVTIDHDEKGVHIPWVFGWGSIDSPFADPGQVKDGLLSKSAMQIAIPKSTFTDILGPMITNSVSSDEFRKFVKDMIGGTQNGSASEHDENSEDVVIPQCDGSVSLGELKISDVEELEIGKAKIENVSFSQNTLGASINADNVSVNFNLIKDSDGNGEPDQDPIPLKISFRKVVIDLLLKAEKNAPILLTSPHTDCDYKGARFCKSVPAAIIPSNFVGDATPFGGFVKCEGGGDTCDALNSLNAQTGLINEKVLDAVNSAIYCGGSSALTRLVHEGIRRKFELKMLGDIFGPFALPLGVILDNGVQIENKGLLLTAGFIAGDRDLFSQMPKELQIPSVGVVSDPKGRYLKSADAGDAQLRLAIASDAINYFFFVLNSAGVGRYGGGRGLLDLDLSEPFFNKIGFDFVDNCDAFVESGGESAEEYSPLCNVRPRVSELLGTPLTTYGYFGAKHPLLVRIRGNLALPPHISIVNAGETPVISSQSKDGSSEEDLGANLLDLQVGGHTLTFYALEVDKEKPVDEYGNLPIRLDADGNPVIHSMRPEDPNIWNGQIVSFEVAVLLAVEIGEVETDTEDPTKFVLLVRPMANRTRLVISPVAGSNSTTIPPAALISTLREKLQYAINIYSSKEEAIRIPVPKSISFEEYRTNDLVNLLGLKTLTFGPTGLSLAFDDDIDVISLDLSAAVTQLFHNNGAIFEDTLPH